MSMKGNAESSFEVRGKLTTLDYLLITAYGVAVQNGFDGTVDEWLESLEGLSAYEVAQKNGFKGTEQEWLDSLDGTKVPLERIIEAVAAYFVENPVQDGLPGHDGVTFTPSVDSEGTLSWTNDGGKANPEPVNIMGDKGNKGDKGDPGEDGYTPVKGTDYFTEAEKAAIAKEAAGMVDVPDGVVLYTSQSLTTAQKTQARSNIGAVSMTEVNAAINNSLGKASAALDEMDEVIG